jgi:hypothetical protein
MTKTEKFIFDQLISDSLNDNYKGSTYESLIPDYSKLLNYEIPFRIRSLNVQISHLRKHEKVKGFYTISAIRNYGYKLIPCGGKVD